MSLPHTYCKKCGTIGFSFKKDPSEELCMMCGTLGTRQFVPEQYLDEYGDLNLGQKNKFSKSWSKRHQNSTKKLTTECH